MLCDAPTSPPPTLTGAFGYFEVTHDITKYTKAKIFGSVGKRTPLAIRFSTVGERGNEGMVLRETGKGSARCRKEVEGDDRRSQVESILTLLPLHNRRGEWQR